ncbi:MAG: hypothetical protein CVV05_09525 [Gammaproteobacteria bacterium HGW-Gammaproteobacteria-1]|jgi:hypothetical protein|nr:MAG: hypothetical protein CVV05_09525 [Gammaproteobacteria bacterium HGW-Gammaproteobacteria-1]
MSDNTSKYFDLHISGIGYLNRARVVEPKKGAPFLAVDITAIHGDSDDPQKTRFDCRVSGAEAKKVIEQFMPQINDQGRMAADGTTLRHKVLAGFRLGDLYTDVFTYDKGDKKGTTGVSLKARLLLLDWVKVDGKTVYQAKAETSAEQVSDAPVEVESGTEATDDDVDALLPEEVSLSKDDPNFEARKAELKNKGYRFDGQAKVWRLPQAA